MEEDNLGAPTVEELEQFIAENQTAPTTSAPNESPGDFDGPEPDLIYRVGDEFYLLYELPLDRLGIDDEPHYVLYTGTGTIPQYEYKAESITAAALDKILAVSFDSGGYEEIEGDADIIDSYLEKIKRAAKSRPWILQKETTGDNAGQYVLLSMFIEQLFEPGQVISEAEYKAESNYINQFSQRQLNYWSAITYGEDPVNNAALRQLQQESSVTLASLLRTYAPEGVSEDLVDFLYQKHLTGDYSTAYLTEQVRYLAAPEFAALVDPEIKSKVGEITTGTKQFDQQATNILSKMMGKGYVDGLNEEEFSTISQSLIDPNGARILEAQLQEVFDATYPDKKGLNYSLISAAPRKLADRITGGLDEFGEDEGFFQELINKTSVTEQQKDLRKYGLQQGKQKTVQDLQLAIGSSFGQPIRRLMAT